MDIEQLFVENSIENVEAKLSEMRKNIDKEKEELRLLVSERYRDLIAGADTIVAMETLAQRVCESVSRIQMASDDLHRRGLLGIQSHEHADSQQRLGSRERLYDIGARLKLLMDTPETMWSQLENNNLLDTAMLTTLAQFVYTGLNEEYIDTNFMDFPSLSASSVASSRAVLDQFPVVRRQRSVLKRIEKALLLRCQTVVKNAVLDSSLDVSQCLVAESLLSGISDINAICCRFLQLRTDALLQSLDANRCNSEIMTSSLPNSDGMMTSQDSRPDSNMESCRDGYSTAALAGVVNGECLADRIATAVTIVVGTIKMVYAIFTDGALLELTSSVTYASQLTANQQRCPFSLVGERGSVALRFLADEIKQFRLAVMQNGIPDFNGANLLQLSSLIQDWLQSLTDTVLPSVHLALQEVQCVADLRSIRDSVYNCLLEDKHRNVFSDILRQLSVPAIDVWTLLLHQPIIARAELIIGQSVQSAFDAFVDNVTTFVSDSERLEMESDVTKFRWSEYATDVSTQSVYTEHHDRCTTRHKLSGVSMRRCCYTQPVQTFCLGLDTALSDVISDVTSYTGDGDCDRGGVSSKINGGSLAISGVASFGESLRVETGSLLFDRWADNSRLGEKLKENVQSQLSSLPQRLNGILTDETRPGLEHASVLLMRVARALTELVPSLSHSLDLLAVSQLSSSGRQLWQQLVGELLTSRSSSLCQPWLQAVIGRVTCEFRHAMTSLSLHDLSEFTVWRTEAVAEEQYIYSQLDSDIQLPTAKDSADSSSCGGEDDDASSSRGELTTPLETGALSADIGGERARQGVVRVPVAVRQSLTRAVYSLCQQMALVGATTFGKEVQILLVGRFIDEIIGVYEQCYCQTPADHSHLNNSNDGREMALLSQNQAVQSLFDIRYLRSLIAGRVDQVKSKRFTAVCHSIEQCIDPFDLTVIQPRLQNGVNLYLSQTQTLFGALIPDRLTLSSLTGEGVGYSPTASTTACVVPLPPRSARFPLLAVADSVTIEGATRLTRLAPSIVRDDKLEVHSKSTFAGLDMVLPSTRKFADSLRPSAASFLANLGSNWLSG